MSLNNEDFELNMNAIEALLALDDVESVGENCYTVSLLIRFYVSLFSIDFVYFFLVSFTVHIEINETLYMRN